MKIFEIEKDIEKKPNNDEVKKILADNKEPEREKKTKAVNLLFKASMVDKIKLYAMADKISINQLFELAINDYLEKHQKRLQDKLELIKKILD